MARQSAKLAETATRDAYLERLRDWADTTVDITVGIHRACRGGCDEADFEREVAALRTALSAQIEKGRWFFPNGLKERIGQRKDPAYRGFRQPVLDHLVEIHDAVDNAHWATRDAPRMTVRKGHRAFVSEVQTFLDPTGGTKSTGKPWIDIGSTSGWSTIYRLGEPSRHNSSARSMRGGQGPAARFGTAAEGRRPSRGVQRANLEQGSKA